MQLYIYIEESLIDKSRTKVGLEDGETPKCAEKYDNKTMLGFAEGCTQTNYPITVFNNFK